MKRSPPLWCWLVVLVWLALVSLARSESRRVTYDREPSRGPVATVHGVSCNATSCSPFAATAVCIGEAPACDGSERYSIWLTNAHAVRGTRVNSMSLAIGGVRVFAKPFRCQVDKDPDLALLQSRQTGVPCLALADRDPAIGELVTLVGSPAGLPPRKLSGLVSQSGRLDTAGARILFAAIASEPGDSGGAILNDRGQLCGLAWGGNQQRRDCAFHPVSVLRAWLAAEFFVPNDRGEFLRDRSGQASPERPSEAETRPGAPEAARGAPAAPEGLASGGQAPPALPAINRPLREDRPGGQASPERPSEAETRPDPPEAARGAPAAPGGLAGDAPAIVAWGLSGWQLGLAIAAAAASGGVLTPALILPTLKFAGQTIGLIRRRRRRRSSGTSIAAPAVPNPAAPGAPAAPPVAAGGNSDPKAAATPGGEVRGHAPFPRMLDEARELLRLRQTEGRVAALDALRGMALDDAARLILDDDATPEADKLVVRTLLAKIASQVDEIAPISTKGPGT